MDNMEYGSCFLYLFLPTRFKFTDRALNATQKISQSESLSIISDLPSEANITLWSLTRVPCIPPACDLIILYYLFTWNASVYYLTSLEVRRGAATVYSTATDMQSVMTRIWTLVTTQRFTTRWAVRRIFDGSAEIAKHCTDGSEGGTANSQCLAAMWTSLHSADGKPESVDPRRLLLSSTPTEDLPQRVNFRHRQPRWPENLLTLVTLIKPSCCLYTHLLL